MTQKLSEVLERVRELDQKATKDWYWDCDDLPSSLPTLEGIERGFRCDCSIADNDIRLIAEYRTICPRLASALEVAVKALECYCTGFSNCNACKSRKEIERIVVGGERDE